MKAQFKNSYFRRHSVVAISSYFGALAVLLLATWVAMANVHQRYVALTDAMDILHRLDSRRQRVAANPVVDGALAPVGSPVLEGDTMTVAGAMLLQRVAAAVTRVGGSALSSQVELQGPQSKDGAVSVIVNCELDQPALQKLLYDLEAGMPFLFVEQLAAQALTGPSGEATGRLRVLVAVSGQWEGRK